MYIVMESYFFHELIKQISEKRDFHNGLYTLFFCICKLRNLVQKIYEKLQKKKIRYGLTIISKGME
jgi:hypothetical protein